MAFGFGIGIVEFSVDGLSSRMSALNLGDIYDCIARNKLSQICHTNVLSKNNDYR